MQSYLFILTWFLSPLINLNAEINAKYSSIAILITLIGIAKPIPSADIILIVFIIFMIPKLVTYGVSVAVSSVVLINIFSEFASIICLILYIPNKKINIDDFKFDKKIMKDVLDISLPSTGSRLIGSISYFFEPIILTFIMLHIGYENNYITSEYGIYIDRFFMVSSSLVT